VNAVNTSSFQQDQQALEAQVCAARDNIKGLEEQVRGVEGELQGLFAQREQYQLLTHICESLDQLESMGAGPLFWGEQSGAEDAKERVASARGQATQFLDRIAGIEQRRKKLHESIEDELLNIDDFVAEIARLREQEERKLSEFLVEREISELPYRPMVMPWDRQGEDGRRFRKIILIALLITFSVGTGMNLWELPPREEQVVVEVPERLVKLVKNEPPPPPPKEQQKPPEEKKEEQVAENKPKDEKPTPTEVKQARAKAETVGVLAFKNNFADLMSAADEPQLGVDAKLGADMRKNAGSQAVGLTTQRSLVVAQAAAGSGGINTASLSRNAGGGGKNITGVSFARVTDAIGVNAKGTDRPLSSGPGPSRTDEEIQIVFDRYKAALYRIYNRELRNDPTLRGKMVLRITIEPSGEVSACKVESTDLTSAALSADILARVKKFNFGAKENVPKITILYPIDFLPAT
jgi:outer membrane biosynthesis protein TonB